MSFLNKIFKETKIAISLCKDTNYLFNELNLCYYFIKGSAKLLYTSMVTTCQPSIGRGLNSLYT